MNEDLYITLIYKKISGEINDSEMIELEKWLAESEENRLTAKSVELAWNSSDSKIEIPEVNLDEEFSFIEDRMKEEKHVVNSGEAETISVSLNEKKYRIKNIWWSVAASIAILISAGYFVKQQFYSENSVQWAEVSTENETKMIVLDDKTKISLNRNSTLKYPLKFAKNQRLIKLKGEAFFDVYRDEKRPFAIETIHEKIKVLGTSFNVRAYNNESITSVYVATGAVQFTPKSSENKLILRKGNKGIFHRKKRLLRKIKKTSGNEISWYSRRLKFVDTPLNQVLFQAGKMYNVRFEIMNPKLKSCLFTSTFVNQDIGVFLKTISEVLGVEIVVADDGLYQVKGGNCQ